uniref:Uncharacterized protein n=1 Tax=Echeneis naucrates TaxID=173247 RepID=A0A665WFI2_ECHNA
MRLSRAEYKEIVRWTEQLRPTRQCMKMLKERFPNFLFPLCPNHQSRRRYKIPKGTPAQLRLTFVLIVSILQNMPCV